MLCRGSLAGGCGPGWRLRRYLTSDAIAPTMTARNYPQWAEYHCLLFPNQSVPGFCVEVDAQHSVNAQSCVSLG